MLDTTMKRHLLKYRIEDLMNKDLRFLSQASQRDVLYLDAMIDRKTEMLVREILEYRKSITSLLLILTTDGGLMTTAEEMVMDIRQHYDNVDVTVPDRAMSSGSFIALSADRLMMNYASCLGPLDTQTIQPDGSCRTTASYAHYMQSLMIAKDLTPREEQLLKGIDWGRVESENKEASLPRDILKRTINERILDGSHTVDDIAFDLTNEFKWYSHGRCIRPDRLKDELGINTLDYKTDPLLKWGRDIDVVHSMEQEYKTFMKAAGVVVFVSYNGETYEREHIFGEEGENKKV